MGKIQVLDKQIAELIAAGEVVDRPASFIKDLVENAIDAGATAITVEIKHGGVTFMRVTDNGCGIAREDVPTAFLRHATSKIRKQDDLEAIGTLGFRGEALASVAAVANVEVMTRTADELAGTFYAISGGEQQACEDYGCPQGTTIIVKDIFYNVPARMKFLKKDTVEANAVSGVMDKIALSHPEISLRFIRDGKETLHTPGDGQLKSAIYAVFGKDFTAGLIPVDYEFEHVKVWGFISKPVAARPNRSMQHFFINGRYVKSKTAMVALEQAFKGSLMVGKFPSCVLHIELSYRAVDVNVHPNKLEVRFINEKPIFDAVYHGVQTALNQGDKPIVMDVKKVVSHHPFYVSPEKPEQMQLKTTSSKPIQETNIAQPIQQTAPKQEEAVPASGFAKELFQNSSAEKFQMNDSGSIQNSVSDVQIPTFHHYEKDSPRITYANIDITVDDREDFTKSNSEIRYDEEIPQEKGHQTEAPHQTVTHEEVPQGDEHPCEESAAKTDLKPLRLVGEAFGTYIIAERNCEELVLIDKHAAHERMLYEKLKKQAPGSDSQMLLQPITVTLNKEEYTAVLQALDTFAKAGFELDDFGAGTILVRSAPLSMEHDDVSSAVMEMAGYLSQQKTDITTEHLDWLYHNIACRSAIKAGDKSSPQELLALVEQLEEDDTIRYCPHGRPVKVVIKKKDLEKQFGRIQ